MTREEINILSRNREEIQTDNLLLKALILDARGDWNSAHEIVQSMNNIGARWVHAYLHRKEGDEWNARYWYNLAGKSYPESSLEDEWEAISMELLME